MSSPCRKDMSFSREESSLPHAVLRGDVDAMVTYDGRLADAARDARVPVIQPSLNGDQESGAPSAELREWVTCSPVFAARQFRFPPQYRPYARAGIEVAHHDEQRFLASDTT